MRTVVSTAKSGEESRGAAANNGEESGRETSEFAGELRVRHCDALKLRRTPLDANTLLNGSNQWIPIYLPGFKHTWEVRLLAEH